MWHDGNQTGSGAASDSFPYAPMTDAASLPDFVIIAIFADQAAGIDSNAAIATGYLLPGNHLGEGLQTIRNAPEGGITISPMIMRQLLGQLQPGPRAKDGYDIGLSAQELKVLNLIARGLSQQEVATTLILSRHTVATFIKRIYRKLGVNSRTEAVFEASSLGIIDVRWPKYEPAARHGPALCSCGRAL